MKRFLVPALGAILTLLASHTAFGQAAKTLTLQGSIDLALEKNVTVTQARNTLEAQQSARHAAVGAMLPSLDLNGGFSRSQNWSNQQGGVIFYQGIPISTGSGTDFRANNSFSTGISSQVTLFNGFANTSRVSQSQSNAAAADFTLDRTQQTTINTTVQLYLDVVRTFQLLKVNEDNLKRSEKQLERITESNKVGAVAIADVYRQKVQVGSDELALIQAQSTHEKAKADLIAFLGIDYNQEYRFDLTAIPDSIDTAELAGVNARYSNFEVLCTSGVENRPDYQASVRNV